MRLDSAENNRTVLSEPEKDAIRRQIERLLNSPYFSQSRRSITFLRFVVNNTLDGDVEQIKERTLGVEIFGRNAAYDTASDPIVRVTASEVRKRLAQYYQDTGRHDELLITLPSGSYIPHFHSLAGNGDNGFDEARNRWEAQKTSRNEPGLEAHPAVEVLDVRTVQSAKLDFATIDADADEHVTQPNPLIRPTGRAASFRFILRSAFACFAVALVCVASAYIWHLSHQSAFDFFWKPLLSSSQSVLICVADQVQDSGMAVRDPAEPNRLVWFKNDQISKDNSLTTVAFDDLSSIIRIAAILQSTNRSYTLRSESSTSLTDLRSGPTVFIGAFDNAWTLRLTNPLRFHFASDPGMSRPRIVGQVGQAQSAWSPMGLNSASYRDYAIVARFIDEDTGKPAAIVAGLGRCGTLAAGEFLTDTKSLKQLEHAAQNAGNKQNMEVVLSTQVIDGQPGSPKIEATYFW